MITPKDFRAAIPITKDALTPKAIQDIPGRRVADCQRVSYLAV